MTADRVALGSREWAATTRGALGLRARLGFARDAVIGQLTGPAGPPGPGPGRGRDGGREPPDTRLVRDVAMLAESVYPTALLEHCLRCWWWASILSTVDGLEVDDELLYVSCLLHDLALAEPYRSGEACCFAVHGGDVAFSTLAEYDAPTAFAERAAEAITAHMNVRMSLELGAEAEVLHDAAHLAVCLPNACASRRPASRLAALSSLNVRPGMPSLLRLASRAQYTARTAQAFGRHTARRRSCSRVRTAPRGDPTGRHATPPRRVHRLLPGLDADGGGAAASVTRRRPVAAGDAAARFAQSAGPNPLTGR